MALDVEPLVAQIEDIVDQNDRMRVALRQITDWSDNGAAALYDPVNDRYSLQLPGELIRRIHGLAGSPDSAS